MIAAGHCSRTGAEKDQPSLGSGLFEVTPLIAEIVSVEAIAIADVEVKSSHGTLRILKRGVDSLVVTASRLTCLSFPADLIAYRSNYNLKLYSGKTLK